MTVVLVFMVCKQFGPGLIARRVRNETRSAARRKGETNQQVCSSGFSLLYAGGEFAR